MYLIFKFNVKKNRQVGYMSFNTKVKLIPGVCNGGTVWLIGLWQWFVSLHHFCLTLVTAHFMRYVTYKQCPWWLINWHIYCLLLTFVALINWHIYCLLLTFVAFISCNVEHFK